MENTCAQAEPLSNDQITNIKLCRVKVPAAADSEFSPLLAFFFLLDLHRNFWYLEIKLIVMCQL